jgi:Beta-ketoacyl synthase, C-terminal domain/Beta-ketoacyl synthase, N-terminal domain
MCFYSVWTHQKKATTQAAVLITALITVRILCSPLPEHRGAPMVVPMPRIIRTALRTCHGDLAQTLAVLDCGHGNPGMLAGNFLEHLIAVTRDVCENDTIDQLIFATTKGDSELWSQDVVAECPSGAGSPTDIANKLGQALGISACAISGACASGPLALGVAARGILSGQWNNVVVVGGDRISAFIHDGFRALKAIDPDVCRPFDAARAGLKIGEMVAAVVLRRTESQETVNNSNDAIFLQGWGASLDGNHLTGPTRDGSGMARALRMALARAQTTTPGLIIAHGTGTRFNDDSESLAYAQVCPAAPVTACKGIIGHTLGSCGIGEAVIAHAFYQRKIASGCGNLQKIGCAGAINLLSPGKHALAHGPIVTANAGFGGINGVSVIGPQAPRPFSLPKFTQTQHIILDSHGWSIRSSNNIHDSKRGTWSEPGIDGYLPKLSARMVLGHVDATWGRMDLACRALVTMGHLLGPLPENTAIVLSTESGSAYSDRAYELARRRGDVDPQRFVYTLPTTPIGEASIRLRLRGPGLSVHGCDHTQVMTLAQNLLGDGVTAVLLAWIECDRAPHQAQAIVLQTSAAQSAKQ